MSRPVILSLGLLASIALCQSYGAAQPAPSDVPTVSLVVNGTIKNFDKFKPLVNPESYIQLVPLPADGSVGVTTDSQGRFAYNSDLPKLTVPKKAAFSFVVPNIRPGRYFLAAQRLQVQGTVFITDKQNPFIIDVPADAKSPFTINGGDLIVRIH